MYKRQIIADVVILRVWDTELISRMRSWRAAHPSTLTYEQKTARNYRTNTSASETREK